MPSQTPVQRGLELWLKWQAKANLNQSQKQKTRSLGVCDFCWLVSRRKTALTFGWRRCYRRPLAVGVLWKKWWYRQKPDVSDHEDFPTLPNADRLRRTLAPVKCKLRQGLSFTNWIYILAWILSCVSSCPPKPLESIIREVARSRQAFLSGDPSWVKDIQRTCSDSDAYEFSWCLCMLLSIAAECSIHKK